MSNIKAMTLQQLKGYVNYLIERLGSYDTIGLTLDGIKFDGVTFWDLKTLHKFCSDRLAETDLEILSRKESK
jgi:hypothetical protein